MGLAVFWNDATRSAVVFEGAPGREKIKVKQVDDPSMKAKVYGIEADFTAKGGDFYKVGRAAEEAAMPTRKKAAKQQAKAALLVQKMRDDGYKLAKPGSLEFAYATCMFSGLV